MAKTQPICYYLRNDAIERHLCIRIWWFSDDGKASARLIYVLSSLDLKFMTHCLNQCYQVVNWLDWRTECCCDSKPNADYREITQLLPFDEIFSIYSITIDKLSKPMLPSSTVVNWLDWRTECCAIRNLMLTTRKLLNYCHLTIFFQFIQLLIDKLSKPMLQSSQLTWLTNRVLRDLETNADYGEIIQLLPFDEIFSIY